MKATAAAFSLSIILTAPHQALAWGDDGHKTIALIAQQCLSPTVKSKITAMLVADTDNLTPHDLPSEATWADRYREESNLHYEETEHWHFTAIEISDSNLVAACFGRRPLPPGTLASKGSAEACAVDKIEQFEAELAAPGTPPEERLLALKFLLHFVGDLHQPLHSSDNHDDGANQIMVTVDGFKHKPDDVLHAYWDTQFVDAIAAPPTALANKLLLQITPALAGGWAEGQPEDWAMEAFMIAKNDAYGNPPLSKAKPQHIDSTYVAKAEKDVRLQLSRAGIRLAFALNQSLGPAQADWSTCLHATSNRR